MKTSFIVILFIFLSLPNYSQWIEQTSGITTHLYSVTAIDETHAWAVGAYGKILRTSDGGQNWVVIATLGQVSDIRNVLFFDINTGFCTSGDCVYKTTNGGDNWSEYQLQLVSSIKDSYFLDLEKGWLLSDNGYVYKTTDAGSSWVQQTLPYTVGMRSIHMLDTDTGFVCATNGRLFKTTNGGTNWVSMPNVGSGQLYHIWFSDMNNGLISTQGGIYRTADGGNTWTLVTIISYYDFGFITCNCAAKAWALSTNGAFTSVDHGVTWEKQNTPTFGYATWLWHGLCFANDNVGWMVGASGKLIKTTSAAAWVGDDFVTEPTYKLEQNYPNPFNPVTKIDFELSSSSNISLKVYDLYGKEISTLLSGYKPAGKFSVDFETGNLSSGIYFYTLRYGTRSTTKKMVLLR